MNSNNWLSFPLSPNHSSLPSHLQASESHHQFSLGLVRDNMDNPFQHQEWNIMNCQASNEVPKVADFLGVSKSENQTDLVAFNEIQPNDVADNYFFPSNNTVPVQSTLLVAGANNYEFQENASSLQSLTLSMGSASGKGSTCETSGDTSANTAEVAAAPRRTLDTFGQRTSIYRGVTRHRWTGRYEAHLWDNSCRREGQSRKGRQVYLGGYDKEEKAARAYDMAALKYWGTSTTTNFPISNYEKELEEMKHMTRQEFVAAIRRKSSGFSRGASMYRGVTRHHQHGRWQARIGRVAGNKDLYLGTFSTEEEAAEAYDIAAIKFRGLNAVTNFDMSRYDVKSILESNTLPIGGGAAKRLKEAQAIESSRKRDEMIALGSSLPYAGPTTTASAARFQAYSSLMQQQHQQQQHPLLSYEHQHQHQHQPFLTLQNQHDIYSHEATSSFPAHTYLHLHQAQAQAAASSVPAGYFHPFYNTAGSSSSPGYNLQGSNVSPVMLHGLLNMDGNNNVSSGSGGFSLGIGPNSGGSGSVPDQELSLVKVDYDMPAGGGYGGWSGDSVHGSNPGGVFTTWGD